MPSSLEAPGENSPRPAPGGHSLSCEPFLHLPSEPLSISLTLLPPSPFCPPQLGICSALRVGCPLPPGDPGCALSSVTYAESLLPCQISFCTSSRDEGMDILGVVTPLTTIVPLDCPWPHFTRPLFRHHHQNASPPSTCPIAHYSLLWEIMAFLLTLKICLPYTMRAPQAWTICPPLHARCPHKNLAQHRPRWLLE